jgi:hypothetical protein
VCFLEPGLQEGPIIDELVIVGKHLGLNGLVSFAFEADPIPIVVAASGLF